MGKWSNIDDIFTQEERDSLHHLAIQRECEAVKQITDKIPDPVMPKDIDVKTADFILRCVQGEYHCPFCVDYGYECDCSCASSIEEMIGAIMTAAKVAHGYPESDIVIDYA